MALGREIRLGVDVVQTSGKYSLVLDSSIGDGEGWTKLTRQWLLACHRMYKMEVNISNRHPKLVT